MSRDTIQQRLPLAEQPNVHGRMTAAHARAVRRGPAQKEGCYHV